MSDPALRTVTIQLNTPTANTTGGETASWATVYSGISMRLRNRVPAPVSFPQVGAGVMQWRQRFGIFDAPAPSLTGNPTRYRIVTDEGETYQVSSIDVYEHTTQVGLEVVT